MINWRPAFEHPAQFEDGETMVVAVAVHDRWTEKLQWELSIITIACDQEYFGIDCDGDPWGWDWESVSYWCPISEIVPKENPNGVCA